MLPRAAALRAALGHPRFRGRPSLLLLDSGYLVVRDVREAAEDLGWRVVAVATARGAADGPRFVARLLTALATRRPDFVLTINQLGFDAEGALARLLADARVPHATWFVDHPWLILGDGRPQASPYCQAFTFERATLPWLAAAGFEDPRYLPTATNPRHYHPGRAADPLAARLAARIAFAGGSWWAKARLEPPPAVRRPARALVRRGLARHDRLDRLARHLAGARLPAGVAPHLVARAAVADASMRRRGRLARALAPLGLRVHGDRHWARLAPEAERRGPLHQQRALPVLFATTAVNANVTAEQMPTAVNTRLWDVPACGGFLLTDARQDALLHFDEGREVVVYRSLDEARDLARFYLARPRQRAAIAARARARVMAEHRFSDRLRAIWRIMARRFG